MLTIKDITRAGHVKRWSMVRVAREQTVAEHLYIVTMIAQHILREIRPKMLGYEELLLLEWCLRSDVPEVITGDFPSMIKQKLRDLVPSDPLLYLEKLIDPEYAKLLDEIEGTPLAYIAKIADIQEAIVFLTLEGIGSHAKAVNQKQWKRHALKVEVAHSTYRDQGWRFDKCYEILNSLLSGPDGMMEVEEETR